MRHNLCAREYFTTLRRDSKFITAVLETRAWRLEDTSYEPCERKNVFRGWEVEARDLRGEPQLVTSGQPPRRERHCRAYSGILSSSREARGKVAADHRPPCLSVSF